MNTQVKLHISGITIGQFYTPMSEELRVNIMELPHEREHARVVEHLNNLLTIRDGQLAAARRKPWYARVFGR